MSTKKVPFSTNQITELITSGPVVIYTCDPSNYNTVTFISENIKSQLGYNAEEFINNSDFWISRIHEDDVEGVQKAWAQFFNDETHLYEYRFQHKDGTYRWMRDEIILIKDADGNPESILGYWLEINDQKLAEIERQKSHEILKFKVAEQTQALRQSETRLRLASNQALIAYWRWSFDENKLTYWSENYEKIRHYRNGVPQNYEGMLQPVHRDDKELLLHVYETSDLGPSDFNVEYRILTKDNEVRYIHEHGSVEYDTQGKAVAHIGIIQDITRQKEIENAHRESEARLATAQRISGLGNWQSDIIKDTLWWSEEIFQIFGVDSKTFEVTSEAFYSFVHPDDRDFVISEVTKALEDNIPYNIDHRIVLPSGDVRIVHEQSETVYNKLGEPILMNGTVQDVTDRIKIEEELRSSKAQLEGILKIAPEAVIVIDSKHNIQHFNQGAERMFGYTHEEMEGEKLDILLPQAVREKHSSNINSFAKSENNFRLMEKRSDIFGVRKNGSHFSAMASLSKFEVNNEQIFVAMLHDNTERKLAEENILASKEEAELANRAKSEFLANMSHELRTPLNAILGFSEMLIDKTFGELGDSKNTESAIAIHEAGSHLMQIIGDILDISKIEAGEASIEDAIIDLRQTIDSCIRMIKVRAEEAGIKIEVKLPTDLPTIRADGRHVKQILINLLSNAIKFTPPNGIITIKANLNDENCMVISIADTGVGIAKKDIEKILQPFGQVAESQVRGHTGTGLGLPISNSLVKLHGGHLSIDSELGKGTVITFQFPADRTII